MINNIFKVYSIQKNINNTNIAEIETIILNGLYKFSILGLNQKNISDVKDRIYSALRMQKIINLKSNNKKITVNILPNNGNLDNTYDLAIALSFLNQNDKNILFNDVLAVAGLSISGKVLSTGDILRTLSLAIKNNIKTIVCSAEDVLLLDNKTPNFTNIIKRNNIDFVIGDTLNEILDNLKSKKFYKFNNYKVNNDLKVKSNINICDDLFKIILSISTNRNVLIQRNHNHIIKFIKNLIYYRVTLESNNILKLSEKINKTDKDLLYNYSIPYILHIDSQTTENDIKNSLINSMYGFNIIDNILNINKDVLSFIKKNHISGTICFYDTCPCGKDYVFFTKHDYTDRCLCLQRHILKHRQKINAVSEDLFEFKIMNNISEVNISSYTPEDYLYINNLILKYINHLELYKDIEVNNSQEIEEMIKSKVKEIDMVHVKNIANLSKDIQIYEDIINNKKIEDLFIIDKENVDRAVSLIKKDF